MNTSSTPIVPAGNGTAITTIGSARERKGRHMLLSTGEESGRSCYASCSR